MHFQVNIVVLQVCNPIPSMWRLEWECPHRLTCEHLGRIRRCGLVLMDQMSALSYCASATPACHQAPCCDCHGFSSGTETLRTFPLKVTLVVSLHSSRKATATFCMKLESDKILTSYLTFSCLRYLELSSVGVSREH